ncbi:MAG: DUF4221 family protein [Microscillaceae bacterium]|nr:DUF4221 family protein [Microscillaceae bacterium]
MKKNVILFLCFAYFFVSCEEKNEIKIIPNPKPIDFRQSVSLKLGKTLRISLDSLTAKPYKNINIYEDTEANKDYLHFFNPNNYQIYFYDLATEELAFTIKLESEGENGIGKNIEAYQIKNLDSIFVYNYPAELSIVNRQAKRLITLRVLDTSKRNTRLIIPAPEISVASPIIFRDNVLIMNGYIGGELEDENAYNRPFVVYYNLKTQKLSYGASYTEAYQNANWGGGRLRYSYATYNSDKELIVYSLPVEHYLHSSKDGKNLEKHYAGSKYFDEIVSLDEPKSRPLEMWDSFAAYLERPSYSHVIYDKYRKVYYRLAELPIAKFQKDANPEKMVKRFSVIILDDEFRYLGERLMPSHYNKCLFVLREGLGFVKYIKNGGEDEAVFDIFKVVKKNEK